MPESSPLRRRRVETMTGWSFLRYTLAMGRSIKGQNCVTTREVVREVAGAARFDAMVAALPEPEKELCTRKILAVEWVDFEVWNRVETAYFEKLFARDAEAYARLSKTIGERDFGTVYRAMLKLGSPYFIMDRVAAAWTKIFNFGAMVAVESPRPATVAKPVVLRLTGVPANGSFVHGVRGGIWGVLSATRAKNPTVKVGKVTDAGDESTIDFHCAFE